MTAGDFSTNLNGDVLSPTSSVRPVESHSPQQEAENKGRRKSRPPEADSGSDAESLDEAEHPAEHQLEHQVDRLA